MNKKIIVASLANIANKLDSNKLYSKANDITEIMLKIAQEDPGQDDPSKIDPELPPLNQEVLKARKEQEKNLELSRQELDTKIDNTNSLDELYKLRDQFIDNPIIDEISLQYHIDAIDEKIALLEMTDLKKFQQLISKPYFESNIKNFQAIGSKIELDPEFVNLHEKTKQKIRSYYSNLAKKIQTRSQERGNIPLLNTDAMTGKPDQISSFVIKNLQYEANKIVSPQTLEPLMTNYTQNMMNFMDSNEAEHQLKIQKVMDTYKVDSSQAFLLAMDLKDPKQIGMRSFFQSLQEQRAVEDLIEEFKGLKQIASTILENAKKYAQTGSEDSFAKARKLTLPTSNFAPVRTIHNLNNMVHNNYKSLSKSVSSANSLFTAASEAYQKVQSALNPSRDKDGVKPRSWFDLDNSPEEMRENRNLYSPLYPGSRPPEQ